MFNEIKKCRACGSLSLAPVLDLGKQYLTGIFPRKEDEKITCGPLELVKCYGNQNSCGLVQLRHSYSLSEMYGDNYGYRSGLNGSMVTHLQSLVREIEARLDLNSNDIILDIGSNDSTLLRAYTNQSTRLIGIDPTGNKFKEFYPPYINLVPDFFTAQKFKNIFENKKAKVITSIAMFYDLESPLDFIDDISKILAEDGIWVFEQSYLPTMLEVNAYDTICHEHLEYYSLMDIKWMLNKQGSLEIIDVSLNNSNGGSFRVTVAHKNSKLSRNSHKIEEILKNESTIGIDKLAIYAEFKNRVFGHREALLERFEQYHQQGLTILGYGASTKGNVILQFCNLSSKQLPCIAEVNPYKFGRTTPGTHIPIVSEAEAKSFNPDLFFILPWHFKNDIIKRESTFLKNGKGLFFPLPEIEITRL